MIVGVRSGDSTARGRVGRGGDFVAVQGEVGNQGSGARHGEAIGGVGGYLTAVLGPVNESITLSGRGRQSSGFSILKSSSTCYRSAVFWSN